ncbi:MAG: hypothetical protein JNL90_19790 [Planctomycetes bacterium]|nr:hypothetical protein [Planctomycetota bacterium]
MAALACVLGGFGRWYWRLLGARRLRSGPSAARPLALTPLLCAGLLLVALRQWSASDVRDSPRYLYFYDLLGCAWIWGFALLLVPFGLCARDDVAERSNRAAAHALCGALLGATAAYAGANIGDGPGFEVVLFSAALASGALLLVVLLSSAIGRSIELVTLERDAAAGLRLGGLFAAGGLLAGRAAAGDWKSVEATVRDFVDAGWPLLALAAAAAVIDRIARPTIERPTPSPLALGWIPAIGYVAAALLWVWQLGAP